MGLYASVAVAPDGVLHASYHDLTNGDLKYARCAFDCTTPANWKKVVVLSAHTVGAYTSLGVQSNGRVHVASFMSTGTALMYATCNANCTVPSSWSSAVLDGLLSDVGAYTSLAVRDGVVHIGYYDLKNRDLKYLQRTP